MSSTSPTDSRAWLPLGFVIGALALLVVTPFIESRKVASIRGRGIDLTNEARLLVGEFEGAFAEELVIVSAGPGRVGRSDSTRALAIARERASQQALEAVVRPLGRTAIVDLDSLRAAEQRWRALNPPEAALLLSAAARERQVDAGLQVIDAAERLHQTLLAVATAARDKILRLERIDLALSAGLAGIAIVAMAIVVALERKVRRFAADADDRSRKLERSVELRAMLINGVVHDVKNPLGAAAGYAELLEEGVAGPMNERQTEMIKRFKRLIATAEQTVAELVDLARVDSSEYTMEQRNTNLVATIRQIVDDHQARAAQKSMSLSFRPQADSLWITTDANRVRHVIENLLTNALKYTPAGGKIDLVLSVDDGANRHARISVRDNGPGVPAALRERVFDPFYRMPSSEHRVPGSGLGLAISHRIARLLGGDLTVADAPGGGSEFVLTLPLDGREPPGRSVPLVEKR